MGRWGRLQRQRVSGAGDKGGGSWGEGFGLEEMSKVGGPAQWLLGVCFTVGLAGLENPTGIVKGWVVLGLGLWEGV